MSLIQRCPYYRGVLLEGFHYITLFFCTFLPNAIFLYSGEFGLVYQGEIVHPMNTETVAVKTLKGMVLLTSLKVQYC